MPDEVIGVLWAGLGKNVITRSHPWCTIHEAKTEAGSENSEEQGSTEGVGLKDSAS